MRRFSLLSVVAATAFVSACPKPEAGTSPATTTPNMGPTSQPAQSNAEAHEEHERHASTDREHVDADGVVRRGTALSADIEAVPVSVAMQKAKELDGKRVKLVGTVADVCTKMGCWFVVQGEKAEDRVRISTKAHNIFVPRSSVGMSATVEGTIAAKVLDAKTAQHFEDERELKPGEQRKTITSDVTELAIDVVGLELRKSS